ncbi:MAG TPA: response regulator [bacterium]|nr:response regulator [bacterium]
MAKKVLIADDDDMVRNLIKLTIRDDGYEVHEACDGIEALDMAREIMPDLIVMDVMMPGKVGYQVCQELKEDPDTRQIFVMFLTARGGSLSKETVELSGGDAFLSKPFTPRELRELIQKALSRA